MILTAFFLQGKGVLTTYWLNDVGDVWQATLTKYQKMEELTRASSIPQKSPPLPLAQLRSARASPANSLCPSPNASPTLLRKGSRYRTRKDVNLELQGLDLSNKLLTRANSKNTPIEEKEFVLSIG